MPCNPCCCVTLQQAVRAMSLVLIILSTLQLTFVALALITTVASTLGWNGLESDGTTLHSIAAIPMVERIKSLWNAVVITLVLLVTLSILEVSINIALLKGAVRSDTIRCKRWLKTTIFMVTLDAGLLIWEQTSCRCGELWNIDRSWRILLSLISYGIYLYMILVVSAFVVETKSHNHVERWVVPDCLDVEARPSEDKSNEPVLPYKVYSQVPLIPSYKVNDKPILETPPYKNPSLLSLPTPSFTVL